MVLRNLTLFLLLVCRFFGTIVLKIRKMTKYNELIIEEIKDIEGYFLRKAYGPFKYNYMLCDAIKEVASRAIREIENTTGDIPRCKRFFYLESTDGRTVPVCDNPELDEFWRQVRVRVEANKRRLK